MKERKLPLFRSGDIGGIAYTLAGNIVNYIIVIGVLLYVFEWPEYLVFGRVIPGMSIGLMGSGFYYAWMANRLAKNEGRSDVTALPSGVSTPAMFVYLWGVIAPLNYAIGDPEKVWMVAVAATFLGGVIEALGSFVGPWLRKFLPRAALLGTVGGIALVWMINKGFYDVYADPILGMPVLIIAIIGLIGGYVFPKKIPALLVAVVGGIVYAIVLGRVKPDVSGFGFTLTNPVDGVKAVINGMKLIGPYLAVIIPIQIYNFIETMDNVESAIAAGDKYNVREAQIADGSMTMLSAIFGGVIPNTVWLGHPGLKKGKAGSGYSWISGLVLGAAGIFGAYAFINSIMPPVIAAITFVWCSITIIVQAFREARPFRHGAAVVVAFIPHIADYIYTEVTLALSSQGIYEVTPDIASALTNEGVMWAGVTELKYGAILTGMLWAAITAFIIDKRLDKAGYVGLVAAALALVGFIHSPSLGISLNPYFYGYLIMGIICIVLNLFKGSFTVPDDYDYI
ncbi:xanthine/uracil/vitamin C permease [Vallitalea guaymasensis]|uniref:xanthine/uracil/vitamin C permease n=1 Tax=Vallitalea guaymasensis TaxID=1185412 RepID=UPI00272BF462|nr:xanthine/uracil/vitamin C permease [Vallitalea guaymasensis]